jgi:hypothetical protein
LTSLKAHERPDKHRHCNLRKSLGACRETDVLLLTQHNMRQNLFHYHPPFVCLRNCQTNSLGYVGGDKMQARNKAYHALSGAKTAHFQGVLHFTRL